MGSFTKLTYHIVFGTRYRKPIITESIQERLYKYIGGTIRNKKGALVAIGGVADHVHILARLPGNVCLADAVRDIKSNSTKWINELESKPLWHGWQTGYGGFTVSYSHSEAITEYIRNQAEHHRRKTFREEYIEFLNKHGIDFDMKYLFEDEHVG